MTITEFQAEKIEGARVCSPIFCSRPIPQRRDWKPDVDGADGVRSALDQVSECIVVNAMVAAILRGETPPAFSPDTPRVADDADDAARLLIESGQELSTAVRALTDDDLERTFPMRRGPTPGKIAIEIPYRNMRTTAARSTCCNCSTATPNSTYPHRSAAKRLTGPRPPSPCPFLRLFSA